MKKSLRLTLTLQGIDREAFNAFMTFLTTGVRVLHERDEVQGAMMTIEEVAPPSDLAPPSVAPVSRSLN